MLFKNFLKKVKSRKITEEVELTETEDDEAIEFVEMRVHYYTEGGNFYYSLSFKEHLILAFYAFISNSQAIAYLMMLVNHAYYGSLESLVFPLTVLGYALLDNPRPVSKF